MKVLKNYTNFYIKAMVVLGEILIMNFLIAFIFYFYQDTLADTVSAEDRKTFYVVANMAYLLGLSYVGVVLNKRAVPIEHILDRVLRTVVLHFFVMTIVLYAVNLFKVPFILLLCFSALMACSFACWRVFARLMLKSYRSHGGNYKKIIILGAGSVAMEVYKNLIQNISYGYKFLGFFDDRAPQDYKVPAELVKGSLDDVLAVMDELGVEEIFCALPAGDDRKAIPIINKAENNLVRCFFIPDFKRFLHRKVELSFMEEIPVISLRREPLLRLHNIAIKRLFDIAFSSLFLVTVFPILFIVLGIAIKLSSPGPIFFKQKRTGEDGKDFYCYKFRTMKVNDNADSVQATKGDSRVTKIGSFMRKTNLDEMPQFINVFIGNMSVVGPRPHMLKHTEMYSQIIDKYMVRHFAKPGITGYAQVTGFRGETKDLSEMEGRVKRDVWYIENWSFGLDLRIIFMTVYNMLKGEENAY